MAQEDESDVEISMEGNSTPGRRADPLTGGFFMSLRKGGEECSMIFSGVIAVIFARVETTGMKQWVSAAAAILLLIVATGCSRQPDTVPMTSAHWQTTGADATFLAPKDSPRGVLQLRHGSAELKDTQFGDGTIDFDIGLTGQGIVGIRFHQRDKDNADVFYLRPQPKCSTSFDCIQYMPLEHGAYEWDLFPQYETAAPINSLGWNHIRMVIAGRRLEVFVNGSASPNLVVNDMEGPATKGAIAIHGPASFRNFRVTPEESAALDAPPPRAANFIRDWRVSAPVREPTFMDPGLKELVGERPTYTSMPPDSAAWRSIAAEPDGLINLSRGVGSLKDGSAISLVWLQTTLDSDRDQRTRLHLGWLREIWVYSNGKLIYEDRNLYGLPTASKPPDGRLSLENGSFLLPLRKGHNVITVAIDDNLPENTQHFGWGFAMRFDDPAGVSGVSR